MENKYCQSCGMPMGDTDEMYGTEKHGTKSVDYCKYCYEDGAFTSDCTMKEMIAVCVPHMVSASSEINEEKATCIMEEWFPTLKRWK